MALILVMVERCELETEYYLVGDMGQTQDTALVRDSTTGGVRRRNRWYVLLATRRRRVKYLVPRNDKGASAVSENQARCFGSEEPICARI